MTVDNLSLVYAVGIIATSFFIIVAYFEIRNIKKKKK
jgi:hypothetical protein